MNIFTCKTRIWRGLFLLILMILSSPALCSGVTTSTPRVVIGIVVENMRPDYLERYWDKLGDNGFKKLVEGGSHCTGFRINQHILNSSTGTATLFTGVSPSVHGIIDESWYDRSASKVITAVSDERHTLAGNQGGGNGVSPHLLRASTLGDQLKLATLGKSKVFGIALNEAPAIFSAGFSGDAAWWFDINTGNMVTSTYYSGTPPGWVRVFNEKETAKKFSARNWALLRPIGDYSGSTEDRAPWEKGYGEGKNSFPHSMATLIKNAGNYGPLKTTPFGNSIIKEFALELLDKEQIGDDRYPDLVNIFFSSMDRENNSFGPASMEMEDLYLRLDEDIAAIIDFAETKYGREKVLIFLTANSTADWPVNYLKERFRFPAGEFSPDNAAALLNSWLNITYGDLKWIEHNNGLQIYLNHRLAEINNVDLRDMRRRTAGFLSEFEGVRIAVSGDQVREGQLHNPGGENLLNSWYEGRSGDLLLVLREGWQPVFKSGKSNYSASCHVPLILYGNGIPAQTLHESYDAVRLVPTLTRILGISSPSGCKAEPIPVFTK